jgi:hypothetical protein
LRIYVKEIDRMSLVDKIERQKAKIEKGNPKIELLGSCRSNNGITILNAEAVKDAINLYDTRVNELDISFFIPSSGSGSRMFGAAYDFIKSENPCEETIEFIEHLINSIESFAFYNKLPEATKDDLKTGAINIEEFLKLILNETGFNFGNRPKGLIPFHRYGNFIINPFQEHILQGAEIGGDKARFHFTINAGFADQITHSIKILREITGINFYFDFSVQDEASNSIAFAENGDALYDDGELIRRPAGHGTLIQNLNAVNADLILIRNIDNVQHHDHAKKSVDSRKMLAGALLEFQAKVFDILHKIEKGDSYHTEVAELNNTYDLKLTTDVLSDVEKIKSILNRPSRICGMVRNEGQPGGGPFWVKDDNGSQTRQIVEKSQISAKSSQLTMLIKSTHFNPVEIICAPKNYKGEKFDLEAFNDDSQYFIVNKTHKGKSVKFIEQPGLWNGGMAKWNTLFYEIGNDCFSPVKTVLDLLKPLHRKI